MKKKSSVICGSEDASKDFFIQIYNGVGIDLRFEGIKYHVSKGRGLVNKFILKDISGVFKCGQLSAIMGPSGAGKSSLLNILAGYRSKNVSGDIYVNEHERNPQEFRKITSYIMQDDLLLPHLSVEETMTCSANLKLCEKSDADTKGKIIDDILNVLSLKDAVHTRTNRLSGGQKKRLAIAQELINNPPIMFFDEPTSGLDSASCHQCISLLRTLARGGRTIICTIHQPSAKIFEMFDYLYFLAEGHCIYRGPVNCLIPYLASQDLVCPSYHNPADYFMEVACGEHGDNVLRLVLALRRGLLDQVITSLVKPHSRENVNGASSRHASPGFLDSDLTIADERSPLVLGGMNNSNSECNPCRQNAMDQKRDETSVQLDFRCNGPSKKTESKAAGEDARHSRSFETSLLTQFRVLFVRSILSIVRDTTLTHLRLVSHAVVGVLIGLLYFRVGSSGHEVISNAAFIFFSLLFIMFAALMPTVMTFPVEMPIFVREHMNYWYSLKAYYLAKSLADVPFQIFFPVAYGGIVYWMTEQPAEALRFFLFLGICILTSLVGQSLGLVIGAATSLQVAVFLGPVTGIPILLFSGFFLSLDMIPNYLQWLSYVSFTRYSFSGALKVIYALNRTHLDCTRRRRSGTHFPCVREPSLVIEALNAGHHEVYVDYMVLVLFFVALRLLGYFILRWRIRGHR